MRKLGKVQAEVLDCVRRHGYYNAGCGWVWDTHSNTTRILESLVKRGDVVVMPTGGIDVYKPAHSEVWVQAYQVARAKHNNPTVAESFADAVNWDEDKYSPNREGLTKWWEDTIKEMREALHHQ